jgi:high-affinity iron transporter
LGIAIVLIIGCGMIGAFYGLGKDVFSKTEDLWEGIFGILASVIITLMGAALLRVSKLKEKWRVKIARALELRNRNTGATFGNRFKVWAERYAMFVLPFITVLREGLEAVVFVGGVGIGQPATAFPLPVFTGLLAGIFIGFLIYKGANQASLQIFLIVSTCFLYLVAAGLFSKGVWSFQIREWNNIIGGDASEVGSGPGSYNILESVWHVNCCNPELNGGGGWGIFNALLGWTNSATYGSVISYNVYWIAVIITFLLMLYTEKRGHLPFMKPKKIDESATLAVSEADKGNASDESSTEGVGDVEKSAIHETIAAPREISE